MKNTFLKLISIFFLITISVLATPDYPLSFKEIVKPTKITIDDLGEVKLVFEAERDSYSSGGQDAGNGGGALIDSGRPILYDFAKFISPWSFDSWKLKEEALENKLEEEIALDPSFKEDSFLALQYFNTTKASKVLAPKPVLYFHFIIKKISKSDPHLADVIYDIFKYLQWSDITFSKELRPYCELRNLSYLPGGFIDAQDAADVADRCDVYPIALNIFNMVIVHNQFLLKYDLSAINKLGLILHEVIQRYITYKDQGYSKIRDRSFVREVVYLMVVENNTKAGIDRLAQGLL